MNQQLFSYCNYFDSRQRIYYIHKANMFDLYQVLVPVFSIITVLNLVTLKLALRDNVTLTKIMHKKQTKQSAKSENEEENQSRAMLKFLLVNFTPLEFFSVRRAKYKIAFFLALSIVTLASYFLHSPFATAPLGTCVFLMYFFVAIVAHKTASEENQEQSKILRQKYLQVSVCLVTVLLNMVVIGIIFKNYQNSLLTAFISDACINMVLDNFLIRPLVLVLIGLPLSKNETFVAYKKSEQRILQLLELQEEKSLKQVLLVKQERQPVGKDLTKIELNLEIQPIPFQQEPQKKVQQEAINNALDILKKIKKQRLLPLININLEKTMECQVPLDSLFTSNIKEQNSERVQKQNFQQIPQNIQNQEEANNDNYCQNLIVVNPSRHEQIQKQQDKVAEDAMKENFIDEQHRHSQNEEPDKIHAVSSRNEEQNAIVKISQQSSLQPSSRQEPLRIFLNDQFQNQYDQQDYPIDSLRRRTNFMTIDQNGLRNTHTKGVLQIKEQNQQSQEIEEIDLNSPGRRRRQAIHLQLENMNQESKLQVVKRKKKKFSHDHGHHRVIKFSTGQPYLEYLPHMLEKESKGKKSQSINKKDVIVDSRAINTGKKAKKRLIDQQNNENMVHVFRIQDL